MIQPVVSLIIVRAQVMHVAIKHQVLEVAHQPAMAVLAQRAKFA